MNELRTEMTMESNAVIGGLEIENMQLKDDLDTAQQESYWWKKWDTAQSALQGWMNKWRNSEDRVIELERKLDASRKENQQLISLWRDHLDEADIEDDSEWESQARQILWNGSDTARETETDDESVPF